MNSIPKTITINPINSAFIYEFRIFEAHQNQGYGSLALDELAVVLKAKDIQDVYLHVFGHREKALRL